MYNNYSKTESKLCKKTLILIVAIILVTSSIIFSINSSNASSGIVEIASVSSSELVDNKVPLLEKQLISIHYKPINVPSNADIRVFSDNLENTLVYTAYQTDLSQRLSYSFNAKLTKGAYAAVISSSEIVTKIVPFLVVLSGEIVVDMGSFELGQAQELAINMTKEKIGFYR